MHELSVAESILSIVLQVASGRKVKRIKLRVGKLQHVTADSLQFSYDLLAADTCAAGTKIEIEQLPVSILCKSCGSKNGVDGPPLNCISCGSQNVVITSGDDIFLHNVELEDGTLIHNSINPEKQK